MNRILLYINTRCFSGFFAHVCLKKSSYIAEDHFGDGLDVYAILKRLLVAFMCILTKIVVNDAYGINKF